MVVSPILSSVVYPIPLREPEQQISGRYRQPVQGISLPVALQVYFRAALAARELPGCAFHIVIHFPDSGLVLTNPNPYK